MKKYVCSICGYIYDEQKEGVAFNNLPNSWVCPLCGAPKSAFNLLLETAVPKEVVKEKNNANDNKKDDAKKELSNAELNVFCTNLAKGCEKQYKTEEMNLFLEIAEYYKNHSEKTGENKVEDVSVRSKKDISNNFPFAFEKAKENGDRGALRVLTWSEKVSKINDTILDRYKSEGVAFLQNTKVFVCEICGFVYIGNVPPDVCPICKVPKFKIHEVGRA
ncbi:MAG: rubredoxin [Clostridia bacterium]